MGSRALTGVGVRKQRRQGQQNFRDGERWAPLILQNIETDASVGVDVGVINPCSKLQLGGLSTREETSGWQVAERGGEACRAEAAGGAVRCQTQKTHLERVIGREVDVQEVDTPRVRAIRRPHDSRLRNASVTVMNRVLDGI
jgi:hypothetical protein